MNQPMKRSRTSIEAGSVSLVEMGLIITLVAVVVVGFISMFAQSTLNRHEADEKALDCFQVLNADGSECSW